MTSTLADQLTLDNPGYRRDLGDGLTLRWSTADDLDGLLRLYGTVFRQTADEAPNATLQAWVRDMMSDRHPSISSQDFALVEGTQSGTLPRIVAATCLLSQTWHYEDIAISLGRPEVVATEIEYRQRGLVRAIFELIHARSAAKGQLVQGITGIPYFYRQFGYEYALEMPPTRLLTFDRIPEAKSDEPDCYELRRATLADVPTVIRLYNHQSASYTVSAHIEEPYWRWLVDTEQGISAASDPGAIPYIVERTQSDTPGSSLTEVVGYVLTHQHRHSKGASLGIVALGVDRGVSIAEVLPAMLRGLQQEAPNIPAGAGGQEPVAPSRLAFDFDNQHPVCRLLHRSLTTGTETGYAWYVRVPDLPAFIRHIAPVLERRLANSPYSGHSGELLLDFYRGGLRLVFANGRLINADDWRISAWGKAQGGFPPLVFLQLLFGYRSLSELRRSYPDVWADDNSTGLLDTLLPARPSWALWLC